MKQPNELPTELLPCARKLMPNEVPQWQQSYAIPAAAAPAVSHSLVGSRLISIRMQFTSLRLDTVSSSCWISCRRAERTGFDRVELDRLGLARRRGVAAIRYNFTGCHRPRPTNRERKPIDWRSTRPPVWTAGVRRPTKRPTGNTSGDRPVPLRSRPGRGRVGFSMTNRRRRQHSPTHAQLNQLL